MAKKKKIKNEAISSFHKGEHLFTIESLGRGQFIVRLDEDGKRDLLDGYLGNVPKKISDYELMRIIFEIIDVKMFNSRFARTYYDFHDIPELSDVPF